MVLFESVTHYGDFIELIEAISKMLEGIAPSLRKVILSCLSRPPYILVAYFLTLTSEQANAKDLDGFLKILLTLDL